MRNYKAWMVTPWQITSRRWRGLTTPKRVCDFAKKSHVPCGWYTDPYTRKRTPLVDWTSFQKAWNYYRRTGEYWPGFNWKKTYARRPKAQTPRQRRQRKVWRIYAGQRQYRRKAA